MEPHLLRARVGGAKSVAHEPRPQPPGGAELRDFLEKIIVRVEEERQPLAELVDVQSRVEGGLDVRDGVGERERDFLDRGRTGFPDVISADRNRVPVGQLLFAERENIGDDPQRGARRVDVGAPRDVFLQDVVLNRARQLGRRHVLPPSDGDVQRQQDDRGCVDGHRRRDAIERNGVEQRRHVLDRVDRHAHPADLARCQWMIRVVPHLRRQVERHAETADPVRQQVPIPRVGLFGRRKAGVLPHRPQSAAVHGRLNAAGERKLAGEPQGGGSIPVAEVVGRPMWWRLRDRHEDESCRNCNAFHPAAVSRRVSHNCKTAHVRR